MTRTALDPVIDHLARLTDETGIFEHALGLVPRRSNGYTTDDVARALVVAVRWPAPTLQPVDAMIDVYLAFLHDAITSSGVIRNRLTFDRRWQSAMSADAHGRAIWSLSIAATEARQPYVRTGSLALLAKLAPPRDVSLRPGVYAALGAARLLETMPDNVLANQIADGVAGSLPAIGDHSGWLWPEERLNYDNARIPECYLALGGVTGNEHLCEDGLRLLEWLAEIELHEDHFSFAPAAGRGPTDRSPLFDQQPLEATAMVDACVKAWDVTGQPRWLERATIALAWFSGLNDTSTPVYDPHTGAGYDGLTPSGININAGQSRQSPFSGRWNRRLLAAWSGRHSVQRPFLLGDSRRKIGLVLYGPNSLARRGPVTVVQDGFVPGDSAEEIARSSKHPHGLKTTTTVMNGWDLVKVEGDVFSIDIPSLSAAANHAFLRHPVRLVIDLTVVAVCREEGIRWLREMSHRVGRCGGNLVVAVAPGTPLQEHLENEGIATFDGNQLARLLSDVPANYGT